MELKRNGTGSRVKTAMAVASSMAVSANIASATVIGLNFIGDGYGALGQTVTADAYGVALADWVEAPDSETGGPALLSLGGGLITGGWTANNDWAQTTGFAGAPGNDEVNYAYVDDTGDNATITLSGFSAWLAAEGAPAYTIQVIQSTDNGTGFTNTDLFDTDGGALLDTLINPAVGGGGAFAGATGASIALNSDTLFIDPQIRAGSVRGTVAGLIITTIPEPSSMALLGLGGMVVAFFRRRK